MHLRVWGCRGSLPAPGRDTLHYGGNTSSVEVRLDDTLVILDAGTGICALGLKLARERRRRIHLLLTHLHLDHIEGLGFFAPIWSPETELDIWGPPSSMRTIAARVARYFSPPLFPMQLSDVPARLRFHDVPAGAWEIDGLRIRAERVAHLGPTLAYRLEEDGRAVAYIPDHEPALGTPIELRTSDWISGFSIAEKADVLFHDSQYSEAEYEDDKLGWGHSSVADAVAFALRSEAQRVVLFHHDPQHSDAQVSVIGERALELWRGGGRSPELAFEGMEIDL